MSEEMDGNQGDAEARVLGARSLYRQSPRLFVLWVLLGVLFGCKGEDRRAERSSDGQRGGGGGASAVAKLPAAREIEALARAELKTPQAKRRSRLATFLDRAAQAHRARGNLDEALRFARAAAVLAPSASRRQARANLERDLRQSPSGGQAPGGPARPAAQVQARARALYAAERRAGIHARVEIVPFRAGPSDGGIVGPHHRHLAVCLRRRPPWSESQVVLYDLVRDRVRWSVLAPCRNLDFDPLGKRLVAFRDNTVTTFRVRDGARLGAFDLPRTPLSRGALALEPGGRLLAVGYANGAIEIFGLPTGKPRQRIGTLHGFGAYQNIEGLALAPGGKTLVAGSSRGAWGVRQQPHLLSTRTGQILARLRHCSGWAVHPSAHGAYLVAKMGEALTVHDLHAGRLRRTVQIPGTPEHGAFLQRGRWYLWVEGRRLTLVALPKGPIREGMATGLTTGETFLESPKHAAVDDRGKVLVVGTSSGRLARFRFTDRGLASAAPAWLPFGDRPVFDAQGRLRLLGFGTPGQVDMRGKAVARRVTAAPGALVGDNRALSPDGQRLFWVIDNGHHLVSWDLRNRTRRVAPIAPGAGKDPTSFRFTGPLRIGHRWLLVVAGTHRFEIRDGLTTARLATLPRRTWKQHLSALGRTSEGVVACVAEGSKSVTVLRPATGERIRQIRGRHIRSVSLSPDARTVALVERGVGLSLYDLKRSTRRLLIAEKNRSISLLAHEGPGWLALVGQGGHRSALWDLQRGVRLGEVSSIQPQVLVRGGGKTPWQVLAKTSEERHTLYTLRPGQSPETREVRLGPGVARRFAAGGRLVQMDAGALGIELRDLRSGKLQATVLTSDTGQWAVFTPDGYVDASSLGRELLRWRIGAQSYPPDLAWHRQQVPGLLGAILAGDDSFRYPALRHLVDRVSRRRTPRPGPATRPRTADPTRTAIASARAARCAGPPRALSRGAFRAYGRRPSWTAIHRSLSLRDLWSLRGWAYQTALSQNHFLGVVEGMTRAHEVRFFLILLKRERDTFGVPWSLRLPTTRPANGSTREHRGTAAAVAARDYDHDGLPEAKVRYRYLYRRDDGTLRQRTDVALVNVDGARPSLSLHSWILDRLDGDRAALPPGAARLVFRDSDGDGRPDVLLRRLVTSTPAGKQSPPTLETISVKYRYHCLTDRYRLVPGAPSEH